MEKLSPEILKIYTAIGAGKQVQYLCMRGDWIDWKPDCCMPTPKNGEEHAWRVKPTPCPHADLILQYAQDCQEHEKPWEVWECMYDNNGIWKEFDRHPIWSDFYQYRRKPV